MKHSSVLPPVEALQAVLKAAETGSFSAAADGLGITHGALSRRVSAVEHWAGISLFVRHGRGVRLTLEGQRLAARIELAVAMLEDGRSGGKKAAALPTVRVGVVQSFARLWLIPKLPFLEGDPPDLRIEPEVDHRHMTLSDARIAIRLGRGDWPAVSAEPLFRESLYPVAHPSVVNALGSDPAPDRILGYPLIHDASEEGWRLWLSSRFGACERRAVDRILPGYDLALLVAAAGLGIALARSPYGLAFLRCQGLVPVHSHRVDNPNRFHIVTRPGPRDGTVKRLGERLRTLAAGLSP